MTLQITQESLPQAIEALCEQAPLFQKALAEAGPPPLRYSPPGFETLLRVIVAQQVSLQAAAAIWGRVQTLCPEMTPESYLLLEDSDLGKAGMSRPKLKYGRSLAEFMQTGRLAFDRLEAMEDEEAIAEITSVKGLGRWSAEVYLLFSHGRADVWPGDDVGILTGLQWMMESPERPSPKEGREMAESWTPWRAIAARFCWHYRRFLKQQESGIELP